MRNVTKVIAAAALALSGATYAMSQADDQKRPARPLPENTQTPTQTPQAPNAMPNNAAPAPNQGVGSRPIGPPTADDTATKNDKNTTDLKKLEKQGKTSNN